MRLRALFLSGLAGCAALAACNGSSDAPTVRDEEAARAEQIADLAGWDRVFHAPDEAIKWARQYGFHGIAYAPTGGEPPFRAKSEPVTLSSSSADAPNQASFTAEGSAPDTIDRIVFSLKLGDPDNAELAETRFTDLITQYLAKFDLRDEGGVFAAIAKEENADGTVAGAPVTIDTGVQDGATPEVVNVTFTRPDATSPDNSKPQG